MHWRCCKMIYTVTFSPSIDYIPFVENFKVNELNRANEVRYYPGGKGINISRVLTRLKVETTALGFLGGFTGAYIQQFLHEEQVATDFIEIEETTRINVKIKSTRETELNGPSPLLTDEHISQLMTTIQRQLKKNDWVIVSGTIPAAVSDTFFKDLHKVCLQVGAKWILDTSGPRLKSLLQYEPFLVKPNEEELSELVGQKIESKDEVRHFAKQLVEKGIATVVVSLGEAGAVCVTKDSTMIAQAPKGEVVNTVGAGDSLVAGMVSQLARNTSMEVAFKYGVAAGSATAFQEDLCTAEQLNQLLSNVVIQH